MRTVGIWCLIATMMMPLSFAYGASPSKPVGDASREGDPRGDIAAEASESEAMPCVHQSLLEAFQVRQLQTELVVAALSCKLTPRYSEFAETYKSALLGAHEELRAYFGDEGLEGYKSWTANEASQRFVKDESSSCAEAEALYEKLLSGGPVRLKEFAAAEPLAQPRGVASCPVEAYESTKKFDLVCTVTDVRSVLLDGEEIGAGSRYRLSVDLQTMKHCVKWFTAQACDHIYSVQAATKARIVLASSKRQEDWIDRVTGRRSTRLPEAIPIHPKNQKPFKIDAYALAQCEREPFSGLRTAEPKF